MGLNAVYVGAAFLLFGRVMETVKKRGLRTRIGE
jgi:hypothetical protein